MGKTNSTCLYFSVVTVPIKISLSNIRLPWLIFTFAVFFALVQLSLWQTTRAVEKEQRLARIEKLNQQQASTLEFITSLSTGNNTEHSTENINDYPVFIQGKFHPDFLFLLDNQTNKHSLGYRVLQIIQTEKYAALVNLGWVQGSINRQELPTIQPLSGSHQFKGHVRLLEKGIMLMEQDFTQITWPLRVQQIELEKFSKLIGIQLLPFVIYLDTNEALGYEKNWQPIVMPPEKHRAYAFQWLALSIAWLILMISVSGVVSRNTNNKNKKVQ